MHAVPNGPDRCTESRNARTQGPCRDRLEALERENRELRQANESLVAALEDVIRRARLAPVPPCSGAGDAVDAPASPSTETRARPEETAQQEAAVDGEAPWETVLVPRGTSR